MNLPAQWTSFVGREHELSAVARMLDRARLVTLTGAGGVGKTRLALAVAQDIGESFADGVVFVDLAPVIEPEGVPAAVARHQGDDARAEALFEQSLAMQHQIGLPGWRTAATPATLYSGKTHHLQPAATSVLRKPVAMGPNSTGLTSGRAPAALICVAWPNVEAGVRRL